MPQVGKKRFPYTPSGEQAAAGFAAKTGQKMAVKKGDEGMPFVPKGMRKPGTGDEGLPFKPGGRGKGDEGMKLARKKVPKKPPRRTK